MIFFHSVTFSFLFLPNFFFFWRSPRKSSGIHQERSTNVATRVQNRCGVWDGCTGRRTEVSVNELAAATTSKGADVMMWKVPGRRLDLLMVNFDPIVLILIENLFVLLLWMLRASTDVAVDGRMMNKPRHVDGRCVRHPTDSSHEETERSPSAVAGATLTHHSAESHKHSLAHSLCLPHPTIFREPSAGIEINYQTFF